MSVEGGWTLKDDNEKRVMLDPIFTDTLSQVLDLVFGMWPAFISFLRRWQELIGSLIGAAAPLLLWFAIERIKGRRKFVDFDKILMHHINAVLSVRGEIQSFIRSRVPQLIEVIDRAGSQTYAALTVYLHLFAVPTLDDNVLQIETGSSYLEQQIALLLRMSKNFQLAVDDIRRQLEGTFATNKEIAFRKLIPPQGANAQLKDNIIRCKETIEGDFLKQCVPNYIRELATASVATGEILRGGRFSWRRRACPVSFRYFKNSQALMEFRRRTPERIERSLKPGIDLEIERINEAFNRAGEMIESA